MKITPRILLQVTLLCFFLFLNFSCNKDSDLLAEYVVDQEIAKVVPNEVTIDLANAIFTTEEDKSVSFNLLNNTSSNRKGRRRYKSSLKPTIGTITIQKDSIVVYTPSNDYNGKDDIEITLEVTNEDDTTSEEVVTIDVTVEPVTDVVEDIIEVTTAAPVVIEPLKNDTFKKESEVIITEVSKPANGTVVINEDNTITYTPKTDNTIEETPVVETPVIETPVIETPVVETPVVETPVVETPKEDTFNYTTSVTNPDNSVTEETGSIIITAPNKTPITTEPTEMGELKAFPGAEGFGKNATGGRGGKVIYVTNLNASGSGSLKDALDASGARTVVFRVGGTINLGNTRLNLNNPNITIAGETAPGGGILLANGSLVVQTSNVIIRHLRVRESYTDDDCIRIKTSGSPLQNIILDHVSVSWGKDGNLDVSNAWNVTIQNSIISYNSKSCLVNQNSKNVSWIKNIFAMVDQRTVLANTIDHLDLTMETINNFIYGVPGPGGPSHGLKITVENNVAEKSNEYSIRNTRLVDFIAPDRSGNGETNTIENTYLYVNGNDLGDAYTLQVASSASDYVFDKPLYRSTYSPLSTTGLKSLLLANAGAGQGTLQGRDGIDKQVINHINAKTGTIQTSGTWPTIASGTAYTDSDGDGMENSWELANNLDPNDGSDGQKDRNGDGYTNLEEFLYSLTQIKYASLL